MSAAAADPNMVAAMSGRQAGFFAAFATLYFLGAGFSPFLFVVGNVDEYASGVNSTVSASFVSALLSLMQWAPSLLFVTMYSLILLFWIQLCYSSWGHSLVKLRKVFLGLNALVR